MEVGVFLAILIAITITSVLHKAKRSPVSLEEANHLASVEDLKVEIWSTSPQPFDPSRYLLIYGNLFFCRYYIRRDVTYGGAICFLETIAVGVAGRKGWITATFTNGHLTSWKFGDKEPLRRIEPGSEQLHEIWLLQQLFATVGNAVSVMGNNKAVD